MMKSPGFQNMVNSMMPEDRQLDQGGIEDVMQQMQDHPDINSVVGKDNEQKAKVEAAKPQPTS